jgi:soluble lytic murein transglycosylase-like protein
MRVVLFLLLILVCMPPQKVQAYEEPIAGFALVVEARYEITVKEENEINGYIDTYSQIYSIDGDLVRAVIGKESEGDINAYNRNRNGTHDSGLMQINSCNYEWLEDELGITDFYDPEQNIRSGCYILGLLSAKYDNVHRVLMSYNMGETRTRELWQQEIYSSRYSRGVVDRLNQIKEGYKDD